MICDFIVCIKHYEQGNILKGMNTFSYQMLTLTKISQSAPWKILYGFCLKDTEMVLSRILFLWTHIGQVREVIQDAVYYVFISHM